MASFGGHSGGSSNKITKPRAKMQVVKPILKKLSHSEKNSLDLDRGWEEQAIEQMEQSHHAWGGQYGSRSSSTKDVTFAFAAGGIDAHGHVVGTATGAAIASVGLAAGAVGSNSRGKFQHARSASQASTGSTSRGGFVHPFQQTPRTSTPPLSYANSLASFDNARDYSPTITENDDDELTQALSQQPPLHSHHPPPTHSQSNLRRPSLASQRTASSTDITSPAGPLRVATGRSTPAPASRLALGSLTTTASQSDLHLNLNLGALDSPSNPAAPALASPSSSASVAPMSPLRSSLEAAGFPRLRSRSELDTAARAENIRAARRKFEERERAKEEKYDREMIKKRERRDNKQASRVEKESARKASSSEERPSALPTISASSQRPAASRKSTPTSISAGSAPATIASGGLSLGKGFWSGGNASRDALQDEAVTGEKPPMTFASRQYESVPPGATSPPSFGPAPPPGVGDVRFEQARPRRGSNAKRRTQSYWQGFILWLRTKFLRMGGGK
jgi:hypothetical protein